MKFGKNKKNADGGVHDKYHHKVRDYLNATMWAND
jgi:hypothetical protein